MMRTTGLMRDADALVQHFNPACRVARMYPQLPISRLLMSINDFDIPERTLYGSFGGRFIALIAFSPEVLQEILLDLLSFALIDFILLGLKALGAYSVIAAVCMVVGLFFLVAFWEVYAHWKDRREYFMQNSISRPTFIGAHINVNLGIDVNLPERRDLYNKFHVIRSLQSVLHASKYGLTSPEKYAPSVSFEHEWSGEDGLERVLNEQLYDYESVWGLQNGHVTLIPGFGGGEGSSTDQFDFNQNAREKRAKPKQYITKVFPIDIIEDTPSEDATLNVPAFNNPQDDLKLKYSQDHVINYSNDSGSISSQKTKPKNKDSNDVFSPMSSELSRNHLTVDDFESNYRMEISFSDDLSSPLEKTTMEDQQNRAVRLSRSDTLFTAASASSTRAPMHGPIDDDMKSDLSSEASNIDDFLESALFLNIRNRAAVARHMSSMTKNTLSARHDRHEHGGKMADIQNEIIFETDESKINIDQILDEMDSPSLLQSSYHSPYRSPSVKGVGISNTRKVRSKVQLGRPPKKHSSLTSPMGDNKYDKDDTVDSISTVSYRSRLRFAKDKMRKMPEETVSPSSQTVSPLSQNVRNRSDSSTLDINKLLSISNLSPNSTGSSPSLPDPTIPFISRNRRHRSSRYAVSEVKDDRTTPSTPRGPGQQQQQTINSFQSQEDMRFPMLLDDSSEFSSINFPLYD